MVQKFCNVEIMPMVVVGRWRHKGGPLEPHPIFIFQTIFRSNLITMIKKGNLGNQWQSLISSLKMKMKRPILNLHNASIHLWREGVAPWMQSGNDETRSWRFQLFQKFFQLLQKYFQLFQIFFHFSRNIFPLRRSMSSLEGGPSKG